MVKLFLADMALYRSESLASGTSGSQGTSTAVFLRRPIFDVLFVFVDRPFLQHLSGGTRVGVGLFVIDKPFFREDPFPGTRGAVDDLHGGYVGLYILVMAEEEVFFCAVLAVGDHGRYRGGSVFFSCSSMRMPISCPSSTIPGVTFTVVITSWSPSTAR